MAITSPLITQVPSPSSVLIKQDVMPAAPSIATAGMAQRAAQGYQAPGSFQEYLTGMQSFNEPVKTPQAGATVPGQQSAPASSSPVARPSQMTGTTSPTQAKLNAEEIALAKKEGEVGQAKAQAEAAGATSVADRYLQTQAKLQQIYDDRQTAEQRAGEVLETAKAKREYWNAKDQGKVEELLQLRKAATDETLEPNLRQVAASEQARIEAELKEEGAGDVKSYWADKSTGNKVLAAISVALGALGQGLSGGGVNVAMQILDATLAEDRERQLMKLSGADKEVDEAAGAREAIKAQTQDDMATALMMNSAAIDSTIKRMEALNAQINTEQSTVNTEKAVLALRQKQAEIDEQTRKAIAAAQYRQLESTRKATTPDEKQREVTAAQQAAKEAVESGDKAVLLDALKVLLPNAGEKALEQKAGEMLGEGVFTLAPSSKDATNDIDAMAKSRSSVVSKPLQTFPGQEPG